MNDYRDPTTGHVQSEPACSCEGDCDCFGLEAETAAGCSYCATEPIGATVSQDPLAGAIARLEAASKAHNPDAVLSVLRRMP